MGEPTPGSPDPTPVSRGGVAREGRYHFGDGTAEAFIPSTPSTVVPRATS